VFARLMGRKITTEQLYVSRYEAFMFSDYNEERWRRSGSPKDSLDLQEAQRWMHRSEDLATVRALFPIRRDSVNSVTTSIASSLCIPRNHRMRAR